MHQLWRKSITTLAFVLVSAVPAAAMAQAPKTPLALKPDAPERYVVVPGDTLWSIAQRYTDSPWRWSELWSLNKDEIKNPNRIYPGNVIVLDRASGQLSLDSRTVKLTPQVRAESMAMEVIPSIPPHVIEPFLSRPLVIEPDGLDNAPTIVASDASRSVLEAGSRGFVRGIGGSRESDWFMYRRGQPLVDPETKTTLGYEAIYLGTARIFQAGEPAIIQVTSVGLAMLALSSLSKSSRYVGVLYAGLIFFSQAVYGVVESITGDSTMAWLSVPMDLQQIGDLVFRLQPRFHMPGWSAFAVIGLLIAVSAAVLERRVRGIEVVA